MNNEEDTIRPEYSADLIKSGLRGKYTNRYRDQPRQPGSAKGKLIILEEDEQHLEDFKDYLQNG